MQGKVNFRKLIFSAFLFFVFLVPNVFAVSAPPEFPSCVNPQGSLIANYSSGTHGIPGVVTSYQGTDSVYAVTENAVIQCLCTVDGEGIQTNWWKVSSLTEEEIESFKSQGWNFIPDGSAWGLDPVYYLAKNSNYSCRATGGSSNESSSNSSSNSNNNSVGGVSSIGDVLGLAATGNIKVIYGLVFTGLLALTLGYLLNRKNI